MREGGYAEWGIRIGQDGNGNASIRKLGKTEVWQEYGKKLDEKVRVWQEYGKDMKMTMHIDETLLESVIEEYGFESKTEAVDAALREMNRRAKLRRFLSEGLGLTEDELKSSVDPAYEVETLRVAETPAPYGAADPR